MADDEDFWADLLAHIRQRVLIPITGPDLNIVGVGDKKQTLTEIIAQRLMSRYELDMSRTDMTMGGAVAAFIRKRGRDETERLYRVINDIIAEFDDQPCVPLRELANVTDLQLFVSTTPDRLLAQAVNDVRFHGVPRTRELTFSPHQSTGENARNLQAPTDVDTVIVRLFGQAASTPQYAIHDEDLLEWLHSLLSGTGCLPEWLAYALKHQPLLFIGCDMPDWLGRFLLRLSSYTRLSLESKQFFFVHSSAAREPLLSNFFSTYCRRTQVQQLEMRPSEFVAELRARWEAQSPYKINQKLSPDITSPHLTGTPRIFISYIREDIDFVRRLYDVIADDLGGDVWLDERRMYPGDPWEDEVLRSIRRTIRLFLPVISRNTEQQDEGYVFREWREAVNRSYSIPRRRFIIPIIIDEDPQDLSTYDQIPDEFRRLNFGYARAGTPDPNLRSLLIEEIRAIRRGHAA
jgi:TIR domain